MGTGSFGTVIMAKSLKTGKKVAIKLIKEFKSHYAIRKVLREIRLLRKLSEIETNIFTVKILDIYFPKDFD